MVENVYIRRAGMSDMDAVAEVFRQARAFMASLGNPQWQDGFPDADFLKDNISAGNFRLVLSSGETAAVFSVLDYDSDYDVIEGEWLTAGNYLALHTVAVADKFRGAGLARFILKNIADVARSLGKTSVRMDTHEKNLPMQRLMLSEGFELCGKLEVRNGKKRIGFEKLV